MRGSEIVNQINHLAQPGKEFIRWWRRENDFADYELINTFRERVDGTREFEGFELLDKEEMWKRLLDVCPDRLFRQKRIKGEVIVWKHEGTKGTVSEETHPFSAETLMAIFDAETRGDTLV